MENSQNTIIRKQPNEKNWAKDLSRYLTKGDIWIASKHIKRCSKSLIIVTQTRQLFSKVVIPFYIPTSSVEGSNCSSPLPTLGQSQFQPFWWLCNGILLCVFFLYEINIYFKHQYMVVNHTVWCHCLYYSCLSNICLNYPLLLPQHRQTILVLLWKLFWPHGPFESLF